MHFSRIKNYIIYLIGGSPRTGKSILAKKLSEKLKIQYYAVDDLRWSILSYLDPKQISEKLPFEKMYSNNNTDKFFNTYSADQILKAEITESGTLWPGSKALIAHLIACKRSCVIEGVQLLPDYISEIIEKHSASQFKVAYLLKTDENKLVLDLKKNRDETDWIISNTKNDDTYLKVANMVAHYSQYFQKEAGKYNFKCFNMDDNFETQLNKIIIYLQP